MKMVIMFIYDYTDLVDNLTHLKVTTIFIQFI